jgi:CheY-like chemotaxis protein
MASSPRFSAREATPTVGSKLARVAASRQAALVDASGPTVLVVDDDPEFRAVVGEVLSAEGCSVYEAANGREALDLLSDLVPDLILLDLMMPVMNGWDFYAELQRDARFSKTEVAVLSAISRLRPFGQIRALNKPIDLGILLQLLETVDACRRARSSRPRSRGEPS